MPPSSHLKLAASSAATGGRSENSVRTRGLVSRPRRREERRIHTLVPLLPLAGLCLPTRESSKEAAHLGWTRRWGFLIILSSLLYILFPQ
jgi:hypothetical protein